MSQEGWVREGVKGATPVGGMQPLDLPVKGPVSKLHYDALGRRVIPAEAIAAKAGVTPEAAAAITDANHAIQSPKPSAIVAEVSHAGPHSTRVAAQGTGRSGNWLQRQAGRGADAVEGAGNGWHFDRTGLAKASRSEIVGSVVGHAAGAVGTTARVATNVTKGAAKLAFKGSAVALGGTLALGFGANYLLNRSADSYER